MIQFFLAAFALSTLISQSAMDAFAALLFLAITFSIVKHRRQGGSPRWWTPTGFDFLFLAWVGVVLVGYAIDGFNGSKWLTYLLAFKWILFFYVLVLAFQKTEPSEKILKWVCGALAVLSTYAIAVFFLGWDPIKGPDFPMTPVHGGVRTGGLYSNPMTFAHAYGMAFCLLLGPAFYFWRWKRKESFWIFAALLIVGVSVVLSFTRGAWAGVAAAVLLMAFLVSRKMGALALATGGGSIALTAVLWAGFRERLLMSFQFGNNYDSERVWIWKANWQMFLEHPIFGVGYWNNALKIDHYYEKVGAPPGLLHDHAHNQYLHILAGTGVIGLFVYISILLMFFILSVKVFSAISEKNIWHKGLVLGALGVQMCFLVGGITEANLEHSKIKYILSIAWALVVWLGYEYKILREKV